MKPEDIKFIVIHCSDSPQDRGDDASTIDRWHREKGWDMIGYHDVILEDGTVQYGRPTWMPGAHVYGYNKKSIGIVLMGKGVYTGQQWAKLPKHIHKRLEQFPNAVVCGHNDLDKNKGCPLFDVKAWWRAL